MLFKDYIIQEALRIVAKNPKTPSTNNSRETKKPFLPKIDISYFDNVKIIRTKHTKETRHGEEVPRDDGLRDAVILKAVKKAWKKGLKPGVKTMITYKNKKKRYDMIVIEWQKSQNKIIIITTIQDNYKLPTEYFTSSHKNDAKIMTENVEELIELGELDEI
jgi:hypothetical protein